MSLTDRWTKYAMLVECKYCGCEVYPHEEDARDTVESIISGNSYGPDTSIECLKCALERTCDYCTHMLDKQD